MGGLKRGSKICKTTAPYFCFTRCQTLESNIVWKKGRNYTSRPLEGFDIHLALCVRRQASMAVETAFLSSMWLPTARLRWRIQKNDSFAPSRIAKSSPSRVRASLSAAGDAAPSRELSETTKRVSTPSVSYNWLNQWFPITFEENVKDNELYPFRIFDKAYILLRDVGGSYNVMDDLCPHRAAPLSEGRVFSRKTPEGDQTVIECGYHGWRFGCNGACLNIPAKLGKPNKSARIRGVYKTSVARFGLIFVWLGNLNTAPPLSLANDLQRGSERPVVFQRGFHRRIPVPFDILIENGIDPAHVPWAHHKVDSDRRRERSVRRTVQVAEKDPNRAYFDSIFSDIPGGFGLSLQGIKIQYYGSKDKNGDPRFYFLIWVVPESRNLSNLFGIRVMFEPTLKMRLRSILVPRWIQHPMSNLVIDGDNPLLHSVNRSIMKTALRTGKPGWRKLYLLSETKGDGMVVAFRLWFDRIRDRLPFESAPSIHVPETASRFDVNDRYHWHTKDCVVCSTALRNFRLLGHVSRIIALLAVVGAVTAAICCMALAAGQPTTAHAFARYSQALFVMGILMVGVSFASDRAVRSYTYTDKARRLLTTPDTTF